MQPLFARLLKVDEERRTVLARAATEEVDVSDEVFDYSSSKPYFQEWSAATFRDSAGKSLGNVRAMHSPIAAGKLTDIRFIDRDKAIDVELKVVDDGEWDKVLEGVYTGLSIGGRYIKRWSDTVEGRSVTRYTAKPSEISLVDKPCMPSSKFIEVLKRDGTRGEIHFRKIKAPRIVARGGKHVVVDTDGHVYGRHPTRSRAVAQLRALYANKSESALADLGDIAMRLEKRARKDFTQSGSATSGITSYTVGNPRRRKRLSKEGEAPLGDREDQVQDTSQAQPQAADAKGSRRMRRPAPKPEVEEVDNEDPSVSESGRGSTSVTKREFSSKERKASAARGHAMDDGSYPIESVSDLENAIQAYGRAKNKAKTKAHIIRQAKRLGATGKLPEDWSKYEPVVEGEAPVVKLMAATTADLEAIEKGAYSVSSLAAILAQLESWAKGYAYEQAMEGDESEGHNDVGEQVQGKVADLLELLAECAEEEASELREGVATEGPVPLMMSEDAEDLAKHIGEVREVLEKAGARHSKADRALLQKLHDTAVELGADCGAAKITSVGKSDETEESDMRVLKRAARKGGIESEGPRRGSTIGEETDSEHSDNEERDPERGTLDGSAGEDDPHSKSTQREKGGTRRGVGKAAADDGDDGEDGDGADGDGEDGDEEEAPPKKKPKKAKKFDRPRDGEDDDDEEDEMTKGDLVELVATTVAATLQGLGIIQKADRRRETDEDATDDVRRMVAASRRPALFAVERTGAVDKVDRGEERRGTDEVAGVDPLDAALVKRYRAGDGPRPILKNNGTIDQVPSLIKLLHSRGPDQRLTAEEVFSRKSG